MKVHNWKGKINRLTIELTADDCSHVSIRNIYVIGDGQNTNITNNNDNKHEFSDRTQLHGHKIVKLYQHRAMT